MIAYFEEICPSGWDVLFKNNPSGPEEVMSVTLKEYGGKLALCKKTYASASLEELRSQE